MKIKILTDSTSDLPKELIENTNIHVIPIYVNFGLDSYKDGIDLTHEVFYNKLVNEKEFPTTSQPSVNDFKVMFEELVKDADGVISIHLSSKLSGTYDAALQAKALVNSNCPIAVIDSEQVSAALGLLTLEAARAANSFTNFDELVAYCEQLKSKLKLIVLLDTMDYLVKGGRISKTKGLLGKIVSIKPMMTVKNGEVVEYAKARSYAKGIELLNEAATKNLPINELVVTSNTNRANADKLAEGLKQHLAMDRLHFFNFGPTLGAHTGPNALSIAFIQGSSAHG